MLRYTKTGLWQLPIVSSVFKAFQPQNQNPYLSCRYPFVKCEEKNLQWSILLEDNLKRIFHRLDIALISVTQWLSDAQGASPARYVGLCLRPTPFKHNVAPCNGLQGAVAQYAANQTRSTGFFNKTHRTNGLKKNRKKNKCTNRLASSACLSQQLEFSGHLDGGKVLTPDLLSHSHHVEL